MFRYFVSSTNLLIGSTKLLATGNLARDGLIKVVSVYCGICTLYYRYRSDTDTTGIGIDTDTTGIGIDTDTTGIGIDTDTGIGIGPPLLIILEEKSRQLTSLN